MNETGFDFSCFAHHPPKGLKVIVADFVQLRLRGTATIWIIKKTGPDEFTLSAITEVCNREDFVLKGQLPRILRLLGYGGKMPTRAGLA